MSRGTHGCCNNDITPVRHCPSAVLIVSVWLSIFPLFPVTTIVADKIPNVSDGDSVQGSFCSMYCVPNDMAALLPCVVI